MNQLASHPQKKQFSTQLHIYTTFSNHENTDDSYIYFCRVTIKERPNPTYW